MGSSDFEDCSVVITGGCSGIGKATADLMLREGARVAVIDLPGVVSQASNDEIFAVGADVTDERSVTAAMAQIGETHGGIDILVNNAGIGAQGTVADGDVSEWMHVLDVNVLGIVRVTRAALPYLRKSTKAAVVNTCSIAATAGLPKRALYSASKGAVMSLTLAMAADHLREGIRVNCVNPGTTDTPWIAGLLANAADPDYEREALAARQPHGRMVTPSEVAEAIAYPASPRATSTVGAVLAVDGGMQGLRLRPARP
ncbi:MAG: SDR family oxidoreductase [Microbacteriaceae bacterium]